MEQTHVALDSLYNKHKLFSNHNRCLLVYDIEKRAYIYSNNAHLFFIPASNVKILTCLVSLKLLKDRLFFGYLKKQNGNQCLLKPLGDPSFLNPRFHNMGIGRWIKMNCSSLSIMDDYTISPYGAGWAWDDLQEEYSLQRSLLPIYGNLVYSIAIKSSQKHPYDITKRTYYPILSSDSTLQNLFEKMPKKKSRNRKSMTSHHVKKDTIKFPLEVKKNILEKLLTDTLKLPVNSVTPFPFTLDSSWHISHSVSRDEVLKEMMVYSNNFLAEQLLIQIGTIHWNSDQAKEIIDFIVKEQLLTLDENSQWVDASGLSRYNLLSPTDLIKSLELIEKEQGMRWIQENFPVSGQPGTLEQWDDMSEIPYFFAKTGTLKNVFNIAGYLQTKSNKKLIFCQMNNQKVVPNKKLRVQIQKILSYLYQYY